MAGFLDQIEPLKQAALAELRAAPDLAALEQARVNCLGSHGKFTALMKQLGTLSKEEKPAAGKAIISRPRPGQACLTTILSIIWATSSHLSMVSSRRA